MDTLRNFKILAWQFLKILNFLKFLKFLKLLKFLKILDFWNFLKFLKIFEIFLNFWYFRKNLENKYRNCYKSKKCYWWLQEAKYFKAWGFWRKTNKQKNKKKLLHECGFSKLKASRTKNKMYRLETKMLGPSTLSAGRFAASSAARIDYISFKSSHLGPFALRAPMLEQFHIA